MSGKRSRVWRWSSLILGVCLLLPLGASAAQGDVPVGRVLDNYRLPTGNDPLRGRDIPGLAVDPANPRHIVLIDEDFLAGQCDYHVTYDGGKTWPDNGHLKVPSDFADPPCRTFDSGGYAHYNKSVVFGSGQNVYTTFASHRGAQQRPESNVVAGEGDSVIVNHSADGGKTWDVGVVAIAGAKDSRPFVIRPGVAVQPRPQGDKLYVVGWYVINPPGMGASGGQGDRKAVVSTSDDGGKTWSAPVEAQGPDEHVREIAPPVVGPDGSVYIAWRNRDDPSTAPHPIVVAKSSDGGVTWTRTPIGDVGPAPTNIPAPAGSSGYPRMAVDPQSGALYVVYDGFNFGDLDVIFQRSTDGGKTWSAPLRVNDDPKGDGWRQLTPQVFVAPNSRVDVIWVDTRATYPTPVIPKPAGGGDVYYASSTDGGATFSANRRISDRTMNLDEGLLGRIGTYTWWGPAEAPMGNDAILFAWGDPRNGNVDNDTNDIVLTTMQLGSGAGAPEVVHLPKTNPSDLSVAASLQAYPGGAERIGAAFTSKLVVVNKNDVAGAWAGAVLARSNYSPLLVTDGSTLTKDMKDEIKRLRPTGMFVIGDEQSVPQKLVDDIVKAGVNTQIAVPPTVAPTTAAPTTAAPTTAPATTTAPSSTTPVQTTVAAVTTVPASTTTTVVTSTANRANVIRLTGSTPADLAKSVEGALDVRSDGDKANKLPAFQAAVVVNPNTADGAAGLAFAAANRYPVLFADKDGIPQATADALNGSAVQNTYVVGGPDSISDATLAKLPNAKRLGGADMAATTAAVNSEVKARGMPSNIVYVASDSRSADAAVAAAAVARIGGLLVLAPGADAASAEKQVNDIGLGASLDRLVVTKSASSGTSVPAVIFVLIGLVAVIGLALLAAASRQRKASGGSGGGPPAKEPASPSPATAEESAT